MDTALQTPHDNLDIRSIKTIHDYDLLITKDTKLRADIVGSKKDVQAFIAAAGTLHSVTEVLNEKHIRGTISTTSSHLKVFKHKTYNEAQVIANDRGQVMACLQGSEGYLDELKQKTEDGSSDQIVYTETPFFDCFRPSHEVFDFLDTLVQQNLQFMTKFDNVSVTYEGRAIPGFRISTTLNATKASSPEKRTLYMQALLHAREWQAGAATLYAMASMLDDLRAGDEAALRIFDKLDWYFVPIVNVDGYQYTWEVDRMWRTSRHLVEVHGHKVGVDLNRNWPPEDYFNQDPSIVNGETYPGAYPLSEQSAAGLFHFITSLKSLSGILDMHAFGSQVLRPFSNQPGSGDEPFGLRMQTLGNSVRNALSTKEDVQYTSETGAHLYKAYGCFDDGMFLHYNLTVPVLTIEMQGADFVAPQSSIRPVGKNIYLGLRQFAHEALEYRKFIVKEGYADTFDRLSHL
uniref:Peptidase M14 domain-containing protein n=1 Tax=Hyaloperonospora arabidopsidis (strain Emoy2) TaxID=559515 RepID=M4BUC5_HYAAE